MAVSEMKHVTPFSLSTFRAELRYWFVMEFLPVGPCQRQNRKKKLSDFLGFPPMLGGVLVPIPSNIFEAALKRKSVYTVI